MAQTKEVLKEGIPFEGVFGRLSGWEHVADLLGRELGRGAEFAICPFESASSQPSRHGERKVGMAHPPFTGAEKLEETSENVLRDVFAREERIGVADLAHGCMNGGNEDQKQQSFEQLPMTSEDMVIEELDKYPVRDVIWILTIPARMQLGHEFRGRRIGEE